MTNPWQTWLQTLAQTGETMAHAPNPLLAAYAQGWQRWQNTCANAWQTPSEFWQTVSAIQTARAQSISHFWQQQPQQLSAFIAAESVPQACAQLTRWYGSNAVQAINLAVTTQAHRSNLWQQWVRAAQPATTPTATPQATTPSTASSSGNNTPGTSKANTQPATKAAEAPVTPWHMQSHYPTQHLTQPQPAAAPAQPAGTEQMTLLNGTTGLAHAVTSSTANSVMRGNPGGTASAAAVARRSVVARRASNRRRVVHTSR